MEAIGIRLTYKEGRMKTMSYHVRQRIWYGENVERDGKRRLVNPGPSHRLVATHLG